MKMWIVFNVLIFLIIPSIHAFFPHNRCTQQIISTYSNCRINQLLYGKRGKDSNTGDKMIEVKSEKKKRPPIINNMHTPTLIEIAETYRGKEIPIQIRKNLNFLEAALLNDMSIFEVKYPTQAFPIAFSERFQRISKKGEWMGNDLERISHTAALSTVRSPSQPSRVYYDDISRAHICTSDTSDLEEVTLKDLQMNAINTGKVVTVQVVEPCYYDNGVMALVEDSLGMLVSVSVYNLIPCSSSQTHADQSLPTGTRFAIKEPYLKCMNSGYFGIQVDNPCNLDVYSAPQSKLPVTESTTESDISNDYGPLVIGDAGIKGRGMILTRNVKQGEVLFRETVFAHELNDKPDTSAVNLKANSYSDWSQLALIANLVMRTTADKKANDRLSLLSSERKSVDVVPTLDMFSTDSFPSAPQLSALKIEGIITINAYQITIGNKRGTGLWVVASMFNHDTFPNAALSFSGKVLSLIANRDIAAGTEVTVSYGMDTGLLKRKWGI
jgi:hypothetical protein